MKNFFTNLLEEPQSQPAFKFVPQIKISSKSTLHLQVQPSDPHTASNIVINAYQSKTNRTLVPIRIQWSRYKFKSDQQFTVQKIPNIVGNTYMCQPSDLGSVIQAKVQSFDPLIQGQAEATIGPIRIDPMLKRLIQGALHNQSLLSQIIIVEGQQKFDVDLRMSKSTMEFTDKKSSQKLVMPYTFSQPKIQLSPKDPCKVYFRFQQDAINTVRRWLNKITGSQINQQVNMNQSSMSIKVPHSNVSSMTSKTKLFQKSHVHCINKLETRFLNRNSRDLFLFTLRAFICKQDMKNSLIMQKIETLQKCQNFDKFLEYISLKSQIIRLAEIAKQLQSDRDSKVKDIMNMQESISQMTLTYLKIIEEKSQNQHVDLQQSYSMISLKRQQILGRKNVRQLKAENEQLKNHIRQLNQQMELNKFFKKDANEQSMVFNQTSNPFLKKQNTSGMIDQNQSGSYYIAGQQVRPSDPTHKNMLEISKSYMKVLEQNQKLKKKSGSKRSNNNQSMGIQNLLESLHQNQEEQKRLAEMQAKLQTMKDEIQRLNQVNKVLITQNTDIKTRLSQVSLHLGSSPLNGSYRNSPSKIQQSYYSNAQSASMISNSYMSMNQSMTSEAQLGLLQKKLIELSNLNCKFEAENTRLRKQRDYFRSLYDSQNLKNKLIKVEPSRDIEQSNIKLSNKQNLQASNLIVSDHENSVIINLKQQKQKLQNQKNSLLKKIESLTRQSNSLSNKGDPTLQKRSQQIMRQNERLIEQNEGLKKTIENIKSFHELQKRQIQNNVKSQGINIKDNSSSLIKDQQIDRLKRVNSSLLNEIKQLKMNIERRNDENLDNSRVIQLQNQLSIFRSYSTSNGLNSGQNNRQLNTNDKIIQQMTQLKKQNQRLKQQISTLQLKIKNQTNTIQKLMNQLDQLHHNSQLLNISGTQNSFNKKYLTPPGTPGKTDSSQVQKYKKKLIQMQSQLQILRRNSQAVNRSRDLSMSMMGYEQQRLQLYKKQNESMMLQIQNLNKMCSKYSRDARQANIELNKLRQKMMSMNKQKLMID